MRFNQLSSSINNLRQSDRVIDTANSVGIVALIVGIGAMAYFVEPKEQQYTAVVNAQHYDDADTVVQIAKDGTQVTVQDPEHYLLDVEYCEQANGYRIADRCNLTTLEVDAATYTMHPAGSHITIKN